MVTLSVRYKFNVLKNKHKGTEAGQRQKSRMQTGNIRLNNFDLKIPEIRKGSLINVSDPFLYNTLLINCFA